MYPRTCVGVRTPHIDGKWVILKRGIEDYKIIVQESARTRKHMWGSAPRGKLGALGPSEEEYCVRGPHIAWSLAH